MNILGLTSAMTGYHDSSAVWVHDGKIEFAISEERFTRVKHDRNFPVNSLNEILKVSKLSPNDFDGVAIAWKPYNAFSGFFSNNVLDVPKTVFYTLLTSPKTTINYTWNNFVKFKVLGQKNHLSLLGFPKEKIFYFSHHLSHAVSSYRTSGFEKALSVNLDCFGPDENQNLWSGASYICHNNKIQLIEYIPVFASMGLFYSTVSVCLGFKFGDGEGKTMGLSAYGNPDKVYKELKVIAPHFDGTQWRGHNSWSDFRLIDNPHLLFNTRWGKYLRKLIKENKREDVAATAQKLLEEELNNYFDYLISQTDIHDVVLAGGIFLNVKYNRILSERNDVNSVYVHPFPSDGGTAAGAALELYSRLTKNKTNYNMPSAYLGTSYSDKKIEESLASYSDKVEYKQVNNISEIAADVISKGEIIGWFQGRAEWGPRALGNRSVLGDPRNSETKERLNKHLKSRDWFMPFAPSILEEYREEYFENSSYTPFMTFAFKVREDKKSLIPAAIHKDGTARPNMVRRTVNPLYYELIENFKKISGVPVILNTSFNRHGLPLVNTPIDAINHLLWGCVDKLCIGSFVVTRKTSIEKVDIFSKNALKQAYIDEEAFLATFGNKK
ncbi:MAG: carbamoyltransferase family protein [Candidatus Helarchaeota archaeon]